MGLVAKVLSFVRTERNGAKITDVKLDPGGGANMTAEEYGPIGDDSQSLSGDYAVVVSVQGTGRGAVIGYLDPNAQQKAGPGERMLYSRASNGMAVAEIWLKSDGEVTTTNANGHVTLKPDGAVLVGDADQAQVLGDQTTVFIGLMLDQIIALCTASTTMGSVLGADIAVELTALKTAMTGNSGDGEILSNKHKTGLN